MTGILGGLIGSLGNKTLTFVAALDVNSVSALQVTITHPGTVQVGDLMVLFYNGWDNDNERFDSNPLNITPIYLNSYGYASATAMGLAISAERLTTLTAITTNTTNGGFDHLSYVALYFRPNFTISTITASTPVNQGTTGNPTAQTVEASGQTAPLIVLGSIQTTGFTPVFNASTTPAFDDTWDTVGLGINTRVGYKLYNSSPVNHTIDMDDLGTNRLTSLWLRVS
jgi:hypothetical protein